MPLRSSDRAAIEAEIDRVRPLGLDDLRTLWRTTFRSSPSPGFTKGLIARFICWHVQEQAFGGVDPSIATCLDRFARGDKPAADGARRLKPRPAVVNATGLRPRDAFELALAPQSGLKLRKPPEYVQETLARRGAGVDGLRERAAAPRAPRSVLTMSWRCPMDRASRSIRVTTSSSPARMNSRMDTSSVLRCCSYRSP